MSAVDTLNRRDAVAVATPRAATVAWPLAVAALLAGTFALRVWGAKHGMPYAFNADENAHFVPKAIGLFGHAWNPDYFVNPPAYTYVLHLVFLVAFGGREATSHAFATDPTSVFLAARVTSAALGTIAVGLLYLVGARMFDRRVGLLAAAVLSVAFLPVFYAHLGLNDVPTLAPICLALLGVAGIARSGRRRDFVLAGVGLGLACATKYTGGIVLVPLLGAAAVRRGGAAGALRGLALAAVAAVVAFVVANPYAVLTPSAFLDGISHQTSTADEAGGKLGATWNSGIGYYLWTLTWGLGFVPALAAVWGALALVRGERRLALVLLPAPVLFLVFMGTQQRFFGRWLLPIFPILCLLAAYAAFRAVDALARLAPAWRPTLVAVAVVGLCVQGVLYSVHSGLVLSRDDTRNITRAWLVEHVPATTKIVVEPVVPDTWAQDVGRPSKETSNGNRWIKFPTSRTNIAEDGSTITTGPGRIVNVEDYERITRPELVDRYEAGGFCWVVSGSTQSSRAFAEPDVVPDAVRYYRRLRARGRIVYRVSPYGDPKARVPFNFDWSFDFYPLAYERPGPVMTVYRLDRGACA